MGHARRIAWSLTGGFALLLLVRLLQGGRLGGAPDPAWGLRALWHHGSTPQALALSAAVGGVVAIAWATGARVRRDDPHRPLSWGALLFFAAGLADAVAGTYFHFVPARPGSFVPWILFAARSAALAVAIPALFFRLRGAGTALIPPGVALTLLGVGLFLTSAEKRPPRRERYDTPARLVAAARALDDLREAPDELRALRRRIVASGVDGIQALLDAPGEDDWWTWNVLLEFGPDARPALLNGLSRPNPVARRRAARTLASFAHDPDIARAMLPFLSDPDGWVRIFAARFFNDGSDEAKERTSAVVLPEALEPLKALLRDPDEELRRAAVGALRHQALHAALPDLRRLLRFEPSRQVREEAHESLLRMRSPEAFRVLILDVSKECSHSRTPFEPLDARFMELAVELLELPAARGLLSVDYKEPIRLPERHLKRLLEAAASKDLELRGPALDALARLDDPRAIELCRAAIAGPERWRVLEGLRRKGLLTAEEILNNAPQLAGPEDVDLLAPLEARLQDPETTWKQALRTLSTLRAIDPDRAAGAALRLYEKGVKADLVHFLPPEELRRLLDDPDPAVSLAAVRKLKNIDDPRAARRLVEALCADTPRDLWDLIRLAAEARLKDAAPPICELLSRLPRSTRFEWDAQTLVAALGEIGDPRALDALRDILRRARAGKLKRLEAAATIALFNSGERSHPPSLLRLSLQDSRSGGCECGSDILCRATRALAAAGDVDAVLSAVDEPRARIAALEALGTTKSPRARGALVAGLSHARPDVRRAAALGLGHLGDSSALPELTKAVEDPSRLVREAATWAAGRIRGEDVKPRLSSRRLHTFE